MWSIQLGLVLCHSESLDISDQTEKTMHLDFWEGDCGQLWVEVQDISKQIRRSGYICRSNCASAITFVPSCLILSWLLEQRSTSLREGLGAKATVWKMKVVTNNRARWGERSEMSQAHTFTHPDLGLQMHPWGDFTRLKAVLSHFLWGTCGGGQTRVCVGSLSKCVCGVNALHVMLPPGCFICLMQNTLTVVLNGIKEWKVYRELWTRKARKEGKEREKEDHFSSAGDKRGEAGIKNSTKELSCVSLMTSEAAEPGGQTARRAKLPWLVFLSLRSLVWLLGRILISGGSGLWPTRDAMRAFRYCRRVTCHSKGKRLVRLWLIPKRKHCQCLRWQQKHWFGLQLRRRLVPTHPYDLQVSEGSDGVVGTIAGRACSLSWIKGIPGRVTVAWHGRLVHCKHTCADTQVNILSKNTNNSKGFVVFMM